MHKIDFSGQVAIVTGAGGGIGRECALLLAKRGAKVLVNDYGGDTTGHPGTIDRAEAVAAEIRAGGGIAVANGTAVGTKDSAMAIRDAALTEFGRIDVLMNVAGIVVGGPIDTITDEGLARTAEINYLGMYRLIQAVWPTMKQQGYGRILNVASNAFLGSAEFTAYGSSKGAVVGLTANAALDGAAFGILVNALLPVAATRLVDATADETSNISNAANQWLYANFPPAKVAPAAVALVSRDMTASGENYSAGGGRISRVAYFATDGHFNPELTPEEVISNLAAIRDTGKGRFVQNTLDELATYSASIPFSNQ